MRILLLSLILVGVSACRSAPKSSAQIYEGNAPSIQFQESHAGGPVGRY